MSIDMYKKFVKSDSCGARGARVWIKRNADDYVHAAMEQLSRWSGSDKYAGQLESYEFDAPSFEVALGLLSAWGYTAYDGPGNPFD